MASMANNEQKVPGDIKLHLPGMDPLLFNLQYQEGEKGGSILMTAQNELTKDKYRTVITESSLRKIEIIRKCRLLLNMLLIAFQGQKPDEFTLTIGYSDNPNMPGHEAELAVPSKSSLRLTSQPGHPLVVIIDRVTHYDEEKMWFILEPVEQDKVDRLEAMVRDRQREIVALQVALAQAQEMIDTLQTKINTEMEAHKAKLELEMRQSVREMEARMTDFMTQMEAKMAKSVSETETNMARFVTDMEGNMKSLSELVSTPMVGMWTTNDACKQGFVKWDTTLISSEHPEFLQLEEENSRFVSPTGGIYEIDVVVGFWERHPRKFMLKIDGQTSHTAQVSKVDSKCHLCDVVRLNARQYFEIYYECENAFNAVGRYRKLTVKKL
eukprot:TRINITY_DN8307_c0_g1_i1.p1 TRINITY_DN8307_c0_g1~~TRINITY_DN8307_c0_g1_i1.p1  ORF type:complete len:382 (-),score=65.94 TRINITY_DN8307_c0_g1_i1:51-1196(-)